MTLFPLRRPSLTSLTADAILDLIEERGLGEGDAIPSAAELSDVLGVSRTVVREAVAELAGQGLLTRQQGAQSVVAVPGSSQLERLFRLRFVVRGGDIAQVHELRESVEIAAARLAAHRATGDDIDALRRRLEELRAAEGIDRLHTADLAFHRAVVDASHNDLMQITIGALAPLLDSLLLQVWEGWVASGREVSQLVEAHAAILDAIEAQNPDAAAAAILENLTQGRESTHS